MQVKLVGSFEVDNYEFAAHRMGNVVCSLFTQFSVRFGWYFAETFHILQV